ncbi:MAG: hypothetical protein IT531_07975 [Burkholderiales bacterium]|nr:hypothetical protein [Burkholderiales bacterium]
MDVDASGGGDSWPQFEGEYRRHLSRQGVSATAMDAICARMQEHFLRADVDFGVWGKMPIPEGVTAQQAGECVAALSEIVERLAAQIHQHTKRMMWTIFELETRLETTRTGAGVLVLH